MLDRIGDRTLGKDRETEHQKTGRRGEEEAYFRLRKLGYVMVRGITGLREGEARST